MRCPSEEPCPNIPRLSVFTPCDSFDVFGEFLYWQSTIGGLELGYLTSVSVPLATSDFEIATKNLDFDWDPGFRVGIGYYFKIPAWHLGLS